jgi:CHAT domain-containing protein
MPLVRDHCVLAHVSQAQGRDDEAMRHFEAELEHVVKQREGLDGETDRALRIFNGERFHIFEDFALFLARGSAGRKPDLGRALAVSDQGRVGALLELLKLRGLEAPAWTSAGPDVDALRRLAHGARAAILVFLRGSHEAGVIVVTHSGARFEPLATARVEEASRAFRAAVLSVSTKPAALDAAATAAWDALLARALPDDPAITRVVVTGAGTLSALPFGAMARPGREPLASRFLAARWEIAATPSLASLRTAAEKVRAGAVVCAGFNGGGALYDPVLAAHYGIADLAPLQGAEKEARAMAEALGGVALAGAAATEAAFRAASANAAILHVASHAIADEVDGSRTALLLAPDPGRSDGILTMGDLLELRLKARLVILSGCRTARGETFSGESVGGLARAVLASGARNLVASVGPVDDQTTPKFIVALGRGVQAGTPVPRAFAAAQRSMLADPRTAHPSLWAPFILFGQGDLLR